VCDMFVRKWCTQHQEYQRHLRNCLRCQESLQQLAPVLSLLALAIPGDVGKR